MAGLLLDNHHPLSDIKSTGYHTGQDFIVVISYSVTCKSLKRLRKSHGIKLEGC